MKIKISQNLRSFNAIQCRRRGGVRKIRTYLDVAGGGGFKSSQMSDIETRENYLYALF